MKISLPILRVIANLAFRRGARLACGSSTADAGRCALQIRLLSSVQ